MSQFMKKTFYKQRESFLQILPAREKQFSIPKDVIEEQNLPYEDDKCASHRLNIYYPKNQAGQSLPVIINVHGGGLIIGSKEYNRYFCAQLSQSGYLVFNIEYRLVPDCLFFDQCNDVFRAMDYIKQHLTKYHGLPERVYAVGDSGGACLLTYCAAMQNNQKLALAANVQPSSLKIECLGLISGMFYTHKFDKIGLFLPRYLYGKNYRHGVFAPYINPEHPDIIKSLPPCFLVTSHDDYLHHYTLQFEKALTRYQTPHFLLDFPQNRELSHAFSVIDPYRVESQKVFHDMIHFFENGGTYELR